MKILFVNPVNHDNGYSGFVRMPYLGGYHLARLTPDDVEIDIRDEASQIFDPDSLSYSPDLAAVSVNFTASANRGYEIADSLRKRGIRVTIGGNHATYCTDEALRHADSVVQGEADLIWPKVITDAARGRLERVYTADELPDLTKVKFPRKRNPVLDIPSLDLSSLFDFGGTYRADVMTKALSGSPGLVSRLLGSLKGRLATMFMEGGFDFLLKSRLTGQTTRAFIRSLLEKRLLEFMLENKEAIIRSGSEPMGGYLIKKVMQVGRGCPVDCEFCSVTAFNGKRYRHYRIDQLVADIAELAGDGKGGIDRLIVFADDNIVADPKFAKEFFREIKPLKIHWWSQATIQMARDPELLKLAADSGCIGIFYGFETLKQDTLKAVDKGFKAKDYIEVIKRTHDAGIGVFMGAFVFGLPGDTKEDIKRTVDFCIEQGVDMPQYTIVTPLPGTRLWSRLYGDTTPQEKTWSRYTFTACADPAAVKGLGMSPEELEQAWEDAYRTVMTPDAVSKRLSKTASRAAFAAAMAYFTNYTCTVFSETDYWKTIQGRTQADKAMLS
ncbi:MAG: B12-binding domain-containing radical SAM protein [Nitrospirota bacterium]|nr:B12-binding domain-containing radical SAM protein [Nitrospirota bacterium]